MRRPFCSRDPTFPIVAQPPPGLHRLFEQTIFPPPGRNRETFPTNPLPGKGSAPPGPGNPGKGGGRMGEGKRPRGGGGQLSPLRKPTAHEQAIRPKLHCPGEKNGSPPLNHRRPPPLASLPLAGVTTGTPPFCRKLWQSCHPRRLTKRDSTCIPQSTSSPAPLPAVQENTPSPRRLAKRDGTGIPPKHLFSGAAARSPGNHATPEGWPSGMAPVSPQSTSSPAPLPDAEPTVGGFF